MTRPALVITPLLRSEILSLPEIYQLSFQPTLVNRYCFPEVTLNAYIPWITTRLTAALDASERGEKEGVFVAKRGAVVGAGGREVEGTEGKVEGYAWYSFAPAKAQREKKEERVVRWFPDGADVERSQSFMWGMDEYKEGIEEAHYCASPLLLLPLPVVFDGADFSSSFDSSQPSLRLPSSSRKRYRQASYAQGH
jgi:hypothetical protein